VYTSAFESLLPGRLWPYPSQAFAVQISALVHPSGGSAIERCWQAGRALAQVQQMLAAGIHAPVRSDAQGLSNDCRHERG